MGAVYLAQQSRPVRTVAVKVLIPGNDPDADQQSVFLARFRREADTVAKLEHKNILPIYEYAEAIVDYQQLAYLVMPFIRGGTLRERIHEMNRGGSHFDLKLIASYISQVADALSYAHGLGVIHRDVKPGNLLFHQDGRLLLADFGIVRLKAMPALTSVGSFLGTAEYASPEQISTSEIDFRSDIYSLGTILYELLTGNVPFTGPNPFAVMAKKLHDPVPSIRDVRPDLSSALENVVMKALAKNPADRYQSANLMAADLRAAAASGSSLRLAGDGNNTDLTVAERARGVLAPLAAPVPSPVPAPAQNAFPPTQPARLVASPVVSPVVPPGGVPQSPAPGQWQWPSQAQAPSQGQRPAGVNLAGLPAPSTMDKESDRLHSNGQTPGQDVKTYREGRRLFYYSAALIMLLLQFIVFALIASPSRDGTEIVAMLGILLGGGINYMMLAAIGFTGVTRNRNIRKFVYRTFIVAVIIPVISGVFINFGAVQDGKHPASIIAYVLLLLSNLYALRQLAHVDANKEQIEVAPVHWRPAIVGALTGLLPLTIILIFALQTLSSPSPNSLPLLNLFGVLFIVTIGIPTPGAVMAVWLSAKMSFPTLLRSSAMAGILMSVAAFLLVEIWSLIFPSQTSFLSNLSKTWIAVLIIAGIFSLIGALRGMLDAWVYHERIRR
jgi:serine/threonine protein kinase